MSKTILYFVLSILCFSPGLVIVANGQGQMADAIRTIQGGSEGQCPSIEERGRVRSELHQTVTSVIATIVTQPTEPTTTMPDANTCNGTPGWRRVAFINMTDTRYDCPTGLNLTSYSKRTCGRSHATEGGCSSTTFSVGDQSYSRVCGRMRGYQFGAVEAFRYSSEGIDSNYVDGVSLSHGAAGRRQHIWTFAAGLTEVRTSYPDHDCPCDTANYTAVPAFVGNNYFCESGFSH